MTAAAPAQLSLEALMQRTTAQVGPPRSVFEDAPPRSRSIDARFQEFDRNNPFVYAELVKLTRRAVRAGVTHLGIRCVWERLRWRVEIETYRPAGDPFRLNDHYTSRYVRKLIADHPAWAGLFELRQLRAA